MENQTKVAMMLDPGFLWDRKIENVSQQFEYHPKLRKPFVAVKEAWVRGSTDVEMSALGLYYHYAPKSEINPELCPQIGD